MAETGHPPGRLVWRIGEVVETHHATPRTKSLFLDVPGWEGTKRASTWTFASPPRTATRPSAATRSRPRRRKSVELVVERLDDGEVSPYLTDELRTGDKLELRGPIGGWFTWEVKEGGPLFLVAGGSGIAPLAAMIRHRAAAGSEAPCRLLYSSRSREETIFADELDRLAASDGSLEVIETLTRSQPPGWTGYARRIDDEMLAEVAPSPEQGALTFVCGPTPLVESVATALVELGHDAGRIKTERFGPTGG